MVVSGLLQLISGSGILRFFAQLHSRYLGIVVAVLLALPCWWRSLFVFSSRMDVEERVLWTIRELKTIYMKGGRAGVSGRGVLRLARRRELETSLLFTFFHVQHSVWGSHVETCTNELRRILHCCISVQVLVLRWQWSLLAKYFFQCANFCLKNCKVVELKEWYPLSGVVGLPHWAFLLEGTSCR